MLRIMLNNPQNLSCAAFLAQAPARGFQSRRACFRAGQRRNGSKFARSSLGPSTNWRDEPNASRATARSTVTFNDLPLTRLKQRNGLLVRSSTS